MKKILITAFLLSLLIALGSCAENSTINFKNYKMHDPSYFIKIMTDSKIEYDITFDPNLEKIRLNNENYQLVGVNPFYKIETDNKGISTLIDAYPTGETKILYDSAEFYLKYGEYEKALNIYKTMTKNDSTFFKAWTHLGDCYYLTKDFKSAEKYFLKAIELNPIGYQEYYYLADDYYEMGDYDKALSAAIKAFVLDKKSINVKASLDRILKKSGLALDTNRLVFPCEFDKVSDSHAIIKLSQDTVYESFLPFIVCQAIWEMEKNYTASFAKDSINGLILETKERLIDYAISVESKMTEKKPVSKFGEKIYNLIIKDNYLDALVYWEIIGDKYPNLILLLPQDIRDKMYGYIKKYCLIKI